MWARVKGKTENDLASLPFASEYNFRPGFMKPTKGLRNTLPVYKYMGWLYPIGRLFYKKGFCTLRELGMAMIKTAKSGFEKNIVEGDDIINLAK